MTLKDTTPHAEDVKEDVTPQQEPVENPPEKPKPKAKNPIRRLRRTEEEKRLGIGKIEGQRNLDQGAILAFRKNKGGNKTPPPEKTPQKEPVGDTAKETQELIPEKKEFEPTKPAEQEEGESRKYDPMSFDPKQGSILNLSGLTSQHGSSRDYHIFKAAVGVLLRIDDPFERELVADLLAPIVEHFTRGSGHNLFAESGVVVVFVIGRKMGLIPNIGVFLKEVALEATKDKAKSAGIDLSALGIDLENIDMESFMGQLNDMLKEADGKPNTVEG